MNPDPESTKTCGYGGSGTLPATHTARGRRLLAGKTVIVVDAVGQLMVVGVRRLFDRAGEDSFRASLLHNLAFVQDLFNAGLFVLHLAAFLWP